MTGAGATKAQMIVLAIFALQTAGCDEAASDTTLVGIQETAAETSIDPVPPPMETIEEINPDPLDYEDPEAIIAYASCAEARADGHGELRIGDPSYARHLDADGDGVACEILYRSCAEVRRAGAAPLHSDEPGYGSHLDRDGDGVACEPYPRQY
jgi:hypothetical protein